MAAAVAEEEEEVGVLGKGEGGRGGGARGTRPVVGYRPSRFTVTVHNGVDGSYVGRGEMGPLTS